MPSLPMHVPQFDDAAQQREAATFGMWVFPRDRSPVLRRHVHGLHRISFRVSRGVCGQRHTLLPFGGTNVAVLLVSSATMAFAVRAAREQRAALTWLLAATAALVRAPSVIKGFVYAQEIHGAVLVTRQQLSLCRAARHACAEMFFYLDFLTTGVHALHVTIGILLIAAFAVRARRDLVAGRDPDIGRSARPHGISWTSSGVSDFRRHRSRGPPFMNLATDSKIYLRTTAALLGICPSRLSLPPYLISAHSIPLRP